MVGLSPACRSGGLDSFPAPASTVVLVLQAETSTSQLRLPLSDTSCTCTIPHTSPIATTWAPLELEAEPQAPHLDCSAPPVPSTSLVPFQQHPLSHALATENTACSSHEGTRTPAFPSSPSFLALWLDPASRPQLHRVGTTRSRKAATPRRWRQSIFLKGHTVNMAGAGGKSLTALPQCTAHSPFFEFSATVFKHWQAAAPLKPTLWAQDDHHHHSRGSARTPTSIPSPPPGALLAALPAAACHPCSTPSSSHNHNVSPALRQVYGVSRPPSPPLVQGHPRAQTPLCLTLTHPHLGKPGRELPALTRSTHVPRRDPWPRRQGWCWPQGAARTQVGLCHWWVLETDCF